MKLKTLLLCGFVLFICSPLPTCVRADDAVDGEEDDVTVVEDADDAGKQTGGDATDKKEPAKTDSKDLDEEEGLVKLEPSPDAETMILFTKPTNPKELPTGSMIKFLVGFYNKGERDFIVKHIESSFRYPMDYTFYIQNYTAAQYERVVQPSQEASFDYAFVPGDGYAGRPFGLVVNVRYEDAEGKVFQNAVYNETINIVEDESGFNPETGFLYLVFACIVVLLLLGGQQFLHKMRRKHGMTKKSTYQQQPTVETGTGSNKNDVDFEWIPRDVLNHGNLSPKSGSPGRSPRNRRPGRKAGSDD